MPADLPPHASIEEIQDELDFMDHLIDTLDPEADDFRETLDGHENTKRELKEWLQAKYEEQEALRNLGPDGTADQTNGFQNPTMNRQPSSSGLGYLAAPHAQGIKRGLGVDIYDQRSKRPTPDPSTVGTPTSSQDSDEPIFLPGRSNGSEDRVRQRQTQFEASMKRKRDAEAADRALAQSLSQPQSRPASTFASSSRPGVQTTIGHNGAFMRPPSVKREQGESQQPLPFFSPASHNQPARAAFKAPPQVPSQRFQHEPSIKSEPGPSSSQQLPQRPRPYNGGVIDLTGDDDDDDEDVSEIAPARFTPSARTPRPAYGGYGEPARYPMPGSFPASSLPSQMPQPVYGTATPSYPSYATLNSNSYWNAQSAMRGYNGYNDYNSHNGYKGYGSNIEEANYLINGGRSGGTGSSIDPFSLDDDVLFGGMRPTALGRHAYSGLEDLYNSRYDAIADMDPTRTKEEINALLNNIRPDEELPEHLRVHTPEAMAVKLHKYQEMGLTWLKNCEEGTNKGGVLADDMGLGKTIQMLSLMATRRSEDPRLKTTLIVAPVALMRQWKQEIQSKIKPGPRHSMSVFIHHGSAKKKDFRDLRVYDVVLTTYGSLASELKKMEKFTLRQNNDPDARPYPHEKCALIGPDAHWYRVILDEAQCIKNRSTATARAAFQLNAQYRFCMTGTPMMNHVDELFSLVHFLQIRPYHRWDKFRTDFSGPLKKGSEVLRESAMRKLQTLIKAIMIRRTKQSTFEGQPILVLPERTAAVDNPEFDEGERDFYEHLEKGTRLQFEKYYSEGTVGKQYSAILVLLLRLRQACCHPYLIKDYGVAGVADMKQDEMLEMAKQLDPQVVARIREKEGNFDCSICFDAAPDPAIFIPCGHDACLECFSRITDSSNAIAAGADEGDGAAARCPTCRGPIHKKKITDLKNFKRVHQPELLTEDERKEMDILDDDDKKDNEDDESGSESESETESDDDNADDVDERGNLRGFVIANDDDEADSSNAGPSDAAGNKARSRKASGKSKKGKKSKKAKGKEKAKAKKNVTLADLKTLGARNATARKKYLRQLRETWVSSAKIEKTLEILTAIMDVKIEGEKVLIFSQWTTLLDLLEIPIDERGWGYRRYDGSMNAKLREDAVDDFRSQQDVRIMLVSLKAGNAGLNLNMASQVIIMDPFWNPFIEEQAIDRSHRLGQTRPVQVHKLLIKNTVEDRIMEIQERKREFVGEALDEAAGKNLSRLNVQDLAYLFGVTRNPG
ncbi:hypothetical protein KC353_g5752 [Hortaea werneckii]|uniref:RING-type domain-containing protein n=1 Tax=Hortaea werneckii TaxID=91943 RepID=A0A3M7DAP8_HORWE|nr:hypothetical protein KC353_g5752 [Hortaea werneckii]RMY61365.1 hypothetical protein D0865_01038 [Hortaea werneckii]